MNSELFRSLAPRCSSLKLSGIAIALLGALAAPAHAAISPGDLMPIFINTDGTGPTPDGFAIVALNTIAANEVIYLTDNEITNAAATFFNTGESYSKWVVGGTPIAAGTVLVFDLFDSATPTVTAGAGTVSVLTFAGSANRGFSNGADSLYLYQAAADASANNPTGFISYINIGNVLDGVVPASLSSSYAIAITSGENSGGYTGPRSGQTTFPGYVPLIDNIAGNWTLVAGASAPSAFNTTAFTVPEPSTCALLGLGSAGLLILRRRK